MDLASWPSVLRMSFVGSVGICGGIAMTGTITNSNVALTFGYLSLTWWITGVLGLIVLLNYSRNNTTAYLGLCALSIIVGFTSITLGLSVPLFLKYGASSWIGLTLICYCLTLMIHQTWSARQHFVNCWRNNKDKALERSYDPETGNIYIEEFIRLLKTEVNLFLPIRSTLARDFVEIALVISMIVGLNLRKVYPEVSAIAWGVPSFTFTIVLIQMALLRVQIAVKLRRIEQVDGIKMIPKDEHVHHRNKMPEKRNR